MIAIKCYHQIKNDNENVYSTMIEVIKQQFLITSHNHSYVIMKYLLRYQHKLWLGVVFRKQDLKCCAISDLCFLRGATAS